MKIAKVSQTVAKNTLLEILDEIKSNLPPNPYLKGSLFACKVAVASFFDLYQDEGKEFWNQLREHIARLREELLNSKEFQQSLALTFETLLRTREERKRALIKKIYLDGYISVDDRQVMNLERFYRVSQEISLEALEYLKFIGKEILPRKEKWARKEVSKMNKENREGDDKWWFRLNMRRKPDSEIIMQWIYDEFNPNSKIVQARIPNVLEDGKLRKKQFEREREKENQYAEISSELLSLGLFRYIVSSGGWGSSASGSQTLTKFGHEFIKFVEAMSFA